MRKPEKQFYEWLTRHHVFPGHHDRVENSVGAGQGDVNVCHRGVEIWFELKVGNPSRLKTLIRDTQGAWHQRRVLSGGRVYVLVKHRDYVVVFEAVASMDPARRYRLAAQFTIGDVDRLRQYVENLFLKGV
jgi:hypothetical protein